MMKKIIALILAVAMVFSLCACGNKEKAEKYCSSCGGGISKDVAFCEHCGAAVGDTKTESEDNSNDTSSSTESKTEQTNKPTETSKPTTSSKTSSSTTASSTSSPSTSSKPSTPTHTHNYSAATCTSPAKCSCGATNGSALGHSYSGGVCSRCGGKDSSYVKTYSLGETWVVDGQWEFTVNSVTTHSLCNHYSNSAGGYTNEQVIIIDYTYKNIGYTGSSIDLYISSSAFNVYDETGEAAKTYACIHVNAPKECIIGTKCTAQEDYVLMNNSSNITLSVSRYTSNGQGEAKAKFNLNVN